MGSGPLKVRRRLFACALSFVLTTGIIISFLLLGEAPVQAAAGVNQQINFQGRLLNAQGATVADGYYNIQFKIYQDGDGLSVGNTTGAPAGSLKWTESHLNANSRGVLVKNGFLSVQLGSVTAFGSLVDWNQDTLWLSMNIAGFAAGCTPFASCTPDGEMTPMKRMSSNVYALNAGQLGGISSTGFIQNTTTPQAANYNVTGNGVVGGTFSSTGLVTANGGLTASGAAINLNNNSNFAINIGTGTSTGAVSIGSGLNSFSLDSTALDISATGVISGATGITSTGTINGGVINATSGFQVGGAAIASSNLSDSTNLAKLNATQTFSGANTFSNSSNSFTGNGSGLTSLNASNLASGTVDSARVSGSYTGITGVGALAAGSIATGFGTISTGNTIATTSTVTGNTLASTVATGTAPISVNSTTKVTNLNADLLDGLDSTAFAAASGSANYIQNTNSVQASSNFNISGTGVAGVAFQAPLFDTASGAALNIGINNAASITIGKTGVSTTLGGSLLVQDGTNGAPGIGFASQPGLGIYRSAANQLSLVSPTGSISAVIGAVRKVQLYNLGVSVAATCYNYSSNGSDASGPITSGFCFDASGAIGLRAGVTSQSLGIYNTYTNATNYEAGNVGFAGNVFTIDTQAAGTGTVRSINVGGANATTVNIGSGTNTLSVNTSNIDISSAGAITGATGITMASGNFLQNGTGTFDTASGAVSLNGDTTLAANKSLVLAAGTGTITQTFSTAGAGTATTINATNASGVQTNGLLFNRNAAGGTTTNGVNVTATAGTIINGLSVTNTSGTVTNGLSFSGTIGTDINRGTGTLTANGGGGIGLQTNGVTRATFDTSNGLYLGNGVTAVAPTAFTASGTGSSTTAVAGGALTLQGGNATVGNANGGNINLSGGTGFGTGVNGLVVISTPTFSTTTNDANCYTGGALVAASCTISAASVNSSSAIIVGFNTATQSATLPDPTTTTAGRVVYITAANTSNDFTLLVNGGGTGNSIAMRQNTTATMIWNGADWTAAGASSSTTLQSAYDNTLQSAGGAELIVSKTSTTNGLTIRESSTNPVNGTLLSVQTSSAAVLLSVNSNVTEYSTNGGAETVGASSSTFPANTWSVVGSSAISRYTTAGNFIATGQASVSTVTTAAANDGVKNTLSTSLTAGTNYNVSFATRLSSGTFTDMNVYYSVNGTTASVACTTTQAVATSVQTKVNCTFTAPAAGITSTNAILIRQTGSGTARTFYVDNLSVTIAADYNYATDGTVSDGINFATNWSAVSTATVTRDTTVGNDASDSAKAVTTGAGQGVRNKLSINPLQSTLYRVTAYAASSTAGFNNFTVRYSRDGGTNFASCADYNTQTVSSTVTSFTKITCYITTDSTAATTPYVYFTQTDATGRTVYVDTFSMTLSSNTTPNVQVGGGVNGGPVTLFTLDKGASAPIASNNDALLGSMYYDTTLGKLQCYEADGWGACGSSPDNIVTISPEYTNAVLHGTGIGTMTSDICSGTLDINDGSSSQPTICAATETYNFYKWTSPQASAQTYSIYVTYQLPATFKGFASGQTSLMGRTDNANATVQYQVYRNDTGAGLTACGSTVAVSTGSVSSWQTGIASGAADPSTCSFAAGNSIVFKIDVVASNNANAYIGNLNFTFSNK